MYIHLSFPNVSVKGRSVIIHGTRKYSSSVDGGGFPSLSNKFDVVTLMHEEDKTRIAPSIAATIQESLTRNIERTSDFYCAITNTSDYQKRQYPFIVEFGVYCKSQLRVLLWYKADQYHLIGCNLLLLRHS
jgi:hypothetical protein